MIIEKLTLENVGDVEEIGIAFTTSVQYPGGFKLPAFKNAWSVLLNYKVGEIFAVRDGKRITGLLGCVFTPDMFNGDMTASENFWFVLPEYRKTSAALRLFDAFEKEAQKRNCTKIVMVHLAGAKAESLEALYKRRGYSLVEQTFWKVK